ncbi:NapC/NirT family cytochrome c [Desulfosporosinus sp. BICA1-9]|uniref:NapC/NirT family cytochrome c n=1 Tax=Desulfosporosinus sp. BICA1-9 TaxID=1531958 RepID=UPI00054B2C43|nr:NapC/NirT family cytochrome c [Desulfosporosinus sp. BICA1-9]KJS48862.1 MAG: cytochrome C nitrite reductase [Peptococcaceae bacterium BRH_c23]KJS85789.1 MAG: cytochrome C nitrite reductase [Desulfosporosinus sp. BICA1-9]
MNSLSSRTKKWLLIGLPLLAIGMFFLVAQYERTSTTHYCGTTCHIMKPVYETSFHSTHRETNNVGCKDCHIPHDNILEQIAYKGYSGARDYYKNTFAQPDVLHTKEWSQKILQRNCIRCHSTVVAGINTSDGKQCFECHRGEPHDTPLQPFSSQPIYTSTQ